MKITIDEYKINAIVSYEVLRKKNMNKKEIILDIILGGIFTLKNGLVLDGSYYLFIYPNKCLLVKKIKNKIVDEIDVTNMVDTSTSFKKFILDDYVFKKYRQL